MAGDPLYRKILAGSFEALPPALQAFHNAGGGASGSGSATVQCGHGRMRRMLAALLGLPRPGENVRVDLRVRSENGVEIWERAFNGRRFITRQWERNGFLFERAGLVTLRFRLSADSRGMRFEHCGTTIAGIPIPRFIALRVDADALAQDDGWDLHVSIAAPIVGMISSYSGHIVPTS